MHAAHVLHLAGRWWAIEGDEMVALDAFPEVEGPVALLSDLGDAQNGIISLQGDASAAVPLIEQRLRREGVTEGESHIEVVRKTVLGGSFQALFSAVPMAQWQRLMAWSEQGGDHRLLFPLLQAVHSRLGVGEAAVVRYARKVLFLSAAGKSSAYADALAFDDDQDSLATTIRALGDRVRAALAAGEKPQRIHWFALDAQDEASEASLVEAFAETVGQSPRMATMKRLRDAEGNSLHSAAPELFKNLRIGLSANPRLAAAAYVGERALPWMAAVAALVALVVGYLAFDLDAANDSREQAAAEYRAESERIQAALAGQPAPVIGDDLLMTRGFVERLARADRNGDLVADLTRIRSFADQLVQILRVRLDPASGSLVIEGVMVPGNGSEARLSRFVDRLRVEGLAPTTVPPPPGNQIAGFFSYAIRRAPLVGKEPGA